uniref:Uncharacterized protein n=1 Tax=Cacopsylla melanoneura TaxID=428564 RepID=A0A8D8ZCC5_9HEMI
MFDVMMLVNLHFLGQGIFKVMYHVLMLKYLYNVFVLYPLASIEVFLSFWEFLFVELIYSFTLPGILSFPFLTCVYIIIYSVTLPLRVLSLPAVDFSWNLM